MTDPADRHVIIVGGGLAGALMAVYLARQGYPVDVYERRPDPRTGTADRGRSINLAISTRGIQALRDVGLDHTCLADAIPMRGRCIHSLTGRTAFQPYGTRPEHAIHSISRAALNARLLTAAESFPNVRIHFSMRCTRVDLDGPTARFEHTPDGTTTDASAHLLIGADGAFSAVRRALQKCDRVNFSQQYLEHGYKELTIPPAPNGDFALLPNALHIWPRRRFMMIALPNPDRTFTCTLFLPFEGPDSFAELDDEQAVVRFFRRWFPDALPLMPDLPADFAANPVGSLVTIRCGPWYWRDRVVLIGDAAHAVVPFYGQGMNAAFEDCRVLMACLRRFADDPARALADYYRARKPNTDILADLAIGNFIEMRDHTGKVGFRIRKRTERILHRLFPRWYLPLYSMVTFSLIPYSQAVARARRQSRLWRTAAALAALGAGASLAAAWL